MDVIFQTFLESSSIIWTSFRQSLFYDVTMFLIGIYIFVLFVDIILLLFLRGLKSDIRVGFQGMNIALPKGKTVKKWENIMGKYKSGQESQIKVAVLEADHLAEEVLESIGYSGKNMKEKMQNIKPGQIDNFDDLKKAHEIRNKVVYDKEYKVDHKEIKETLDIYEDFFKNLELL